MSSPERTTLLRISTLGWCGLAIVFVLPWIALVWLAASRIAPSPAPSTPKPASAVPTLPPRATTMQVAPPGRWGQLEYSRIVVEPPEDYISVEFTKPATVRWFFKGYTDAKLNDLWERAGLSVAQREALASPARRSTSEAGIILTPEPEFIVGLTPASRTVLYTALAEFPENTLQHEPFRLHQDVAAAWFEDTGLPADIVTLAKQMLYTRKTSVLFSDSDIVLPRIANVADRVQFLKTISRKSTLLVQLVLDAQSDPAALARYWGRGRRSKDVEPLIHSIVQSGGGRIDIMHLMPPFPRSLIYTYPLPPDRPDATTHDCHWTALNFFNEKPDDRFNDIAFVKQTLLDAYYPVAGPPELGDVIVLVQPNDVVVHSCVYVAADIVFTKNGSGFAVPWLLGNLDSVIAFYSLNTPLQVRRFRLKAQ